MILHLPHKTRKKPMGFQNKQGKGKQHHPKKISHCKEKWKLSSESLRDKKTKNKKQKQKYSTPNTFKIESHKVKVNPQPG